MVKRIWFTSKNCSNPRQLKSNPQSGGKSKKPSRSYTANSTAGNNARTDIKLDTPIDQLKLQNPDHNKLQESL